MTKHNYFIQETFKHAKKGALHEQLGIPVHEKIPEEILRHIAKTKINTHITIFGHPVKVTYLLKKRAVFLLNVDRSKH